MFWSEAGFIKWVYRPMNSPSNVQAKRLTEQRLRNFIRMALSGKLRSTSDYVHQVANEAVRSPLQAKGKIRSINIRQVVDI